MQQKTIEYFDGKQKLIGELFYKDAAAQQAAILVFPAFEGRGDFALDYAKKLAEQGYAAFVVDMYGDAATANTIEGCMKLYTPLSQNRELVRKRAVLAYEAVSQQTHSKKIGAVGFCFGGLCMLELARSGANLHAGIGMHSALAKSDLVTHPIKCKLLLLHGYQDPQVPPAQLQGFAQELESAGVKDWTFTFYGEGKHSFTDPRTGTFDPQKEPEMGRVYDPVLAQRSWRYALDFFKEHLSL